MEWDRQSDPAASVRLGRYTLLCPIAEGELSVVHLARQQSDAGFSRLVALKRLRPELASQREFVQLMEDEAAVGAGLNHANLVAAIDVGGGPGDCFIAFEYVEGASLAGLLQRAGMVRHPRFLAPLFVDVLSGLHAAHTALGPDDEPMQLVHQAPRAEHILVGIDGFARLADFGQVRSPALRPSRLRTDRLRVAHMAPEQLLRPDAVDHRADIFILGTTLWEALTGRTLFEAPNEEQAFQNLLQRPIEAPSDADRALPSCFDEICLRALERDPDERYESAADMARDLRDTAINHALFATAPEVGQWVKSLCGSELIARRRLAGNEAPSQLMRLPAALTGLPPRPPAPEKSSDGQAPSFEEEITSLHLAPSVDSEDSDQVPLLADPGPESSETRTYDAQRFDDAAQRLSDSSVVSALPWPEDYQRKPDSGELPDFSDPDYEPPTGTYEGPPERDGQRVDSPEHEPPTGRMPAPSEQASAFAREHTTRSLPAPPPDALPTPAAGTPIGRQGSLPSGSAQDGPSTAGSDAPAPSSSWPPRPRRDYREENVPEPRARMDSTPTRMRLSSGPVGDVFGSSAPPPPSHAERSALEADLAPTPGQAPPWAGAPLPDSLTPPSQSHSVPAEAPPARSGGWRAAKWTAAGFVGVAAASVLVWTLSRPATPAAPSAASPPGRLEDPDFVGAPEPSEDEASGSAARQGVDPREGIEGSEDDTSPSDALGEAEVEAPDQPTAERPDPSREERARAERRRARRRERARRRAAEEEEAASRRREERAERASRASAASRSRDEVGAGSGKGAASGDAPKRGQGSRAPDWRSRGEAIPDNPF